MGGRLDLGTSSGLRGLAGAAAFVLRACTLFGVVIAVARAVVVGGLLGGVESPLPVALRAETLARMEAAVDARSAALLERAYGEPNRSGIRMLRARVGEGDGLRAAAAAALLAESRLAGTPLEPASLSCARFVLQEMRSVGYDVERVRATYIGRRAASAVALLGVAIACSRLAFGPSAASGRHVLRSEVPGGAGLCLYKD